MAAALAQFLARWTALEPSAAHLVARLLAVLITALLLLLAYRLLTGGLQRVLRSRPVHETTRLRTLVSLVTSLARWAVAFVAVVVILRELGIDVLPLVVSAGVLGLAIGFGSQSLIRDVITGFFLLFEGLIHVGDVVQIGATSGTVESIGLRVTTVRMEDHALRIVPNGLIGEFANLSAGGVRVAVDVPVSRDVPVARALAVLEEVGEAWARESATLDRPRAHGIMGWSGGDVILRLTVQLAPERRLAAEAELRRRIKEAFDQHHWPPIGAAG
ncbi:MAG TPA: mechanosensitive ion channel family protein [Methylomirabilota bacterium]